MNEKSTSDESERVESDEENALDDSATEDAQFDDVEVIAAEPPETRRSALLVLVASVALLASLAALTGVAYLVFVAGPNDAADDATDVYLSALSESIRDNESSLRDLDRKLSALPTESGSAAAEIEAFERRLELKLRGLESLPERMASLESSLSALRGISTGARDAWLLAEAEYYMQIANAQLQLAGNAELARLALELADERIVELGDPGLTDVRRALSNELRELAVLESPDIEGTTLTLASLARVVDALPIRLEVMGADDQTDALEPDAELSGADRAVASLKNALSGIVSVRRTDEAARPLIAPDAVYFLRANLTLQLQAARLAMLRGEQALFQQSLDDASAWLREYYDTEALPVRSALMTIGEIRDQSFTYALPDISESLRLLRQYIAFAAATAAGEPAPEPEPEPELEQ